MVVLSMPFTVCHAAAVLPLRRSGPYLSALVVGSFAPDFTYFLSIRATNGHYWPGVLTVSLPLAVAAYVLYVVLLRKPMIALLPASFQARIKHEEMNDSTLTPASIALTVIALAAGVVSHVVWDSFTHYSGFAVRYWDFLRMRIMIPGVGEISLYKVLQHGSTVFGFLVVVAYVTAWYRSTPACEHTNTNNVFGPAIITLLSVIAGFTVWAQYSYLWTPEVAWAERHIGLVVIAWIRFFLIGLTVYAVIWSGMRNRRFSS